MDVIWRALDSFVAFASFCPAAFFPALSETLTINNKTYRVVKQLGEGGYAFVLLARELPSPLPDAQPDPHAVAIKKIIAASRERLQEGKREIEVLKQLSHPNCLPLLDHAITPCSSGSTVLLVFPAYEDGTLVDELARLTAAGSRLSSRDVLDMFAQICAGVGHMHSRGLAHWDIKPHNVLIRRPRSRRKQQQQQGLLAPSSLQMVMMGGQAAQSAAEPGEPAGAKFDDLEAGTGLLSGRYEGAAAAARYEAVLMDFGSARSTPIYINSRADALAMQEEAEAHCTATFRAPELFDVPSSCVLDSRVDVWSLGCTLFAMMYGASPFQAALDQGASLALAVMNCRIPWPKPPAAAYPDVLHSLVTLCLQVEPARRPSLPQLLDRVQHVMQLLPDPAAS